MYNIKKNGYEIETNLSLSDAKRRVNQLKQEDEQNDDWNYYEIGR